MMMMMIIIIIVYLLQLGCHPVAVVILHVHNMKLFTTKFKSGGLHEKHVVATWNLGNHLSICFRHRETKKNLCRDGRSQDLPNTYF